MTDHVEKPVPSPAEALHQTQGELAGELPPAPLPAFLAGVDRAVERFESTAVVIILVTMVLLACEQSLVRALSSAFLRVGPLHALFEWIDGKTRWVEDFSKHGTIWTAVLGAALATRAGKHVAIDVITRYLPRRAARMTFGVVSLGAAMVSFFLARGLWGSLLHNGGLLAALGNSHFEVDPATGGAAHTYLIQMVLPLGFGLIAARFVMRAFAEFVAGVRPLAVPPLGDPPLGDPPATPPLPAPASPADMGKAVAIMAVVAFAGAMFVSHIPQMPIWFGLTVIIGLGLFGMPLYTVLAGTALFLFAHGVGAPGTDGAVSPVGVASAVEDVLGEKYARSLVLVTIPLFSFAGFLMAESRTPQRLVRVSRALFGWMPGGMAMVCLVASAFFTTFNGASGVTIVAIGGLLLPALIQEKYPHRFSLGLVTTGGSLGLLFPPALPLIIYGIVAGAQQIPNDAKPEFEKLMAAGIIPGMLTVGLLAVYAAFVGVRYKVPRTRFDPAGAGRALWEAKWELVLPVFLLGGLATGKFRIHEAAAFTALYVLIVEVFIYKDLSLFRHVVRRPKGVEEDTRAGAVATHAGPLNSIPAVARDCMAMVGAIMVKLCGATILTSFFIDSQTADRLFNALTCGPAARHAMAVCPDTFNHCSDAVRVLGDHGESAGGLLSSRIGFLIALNGFLLVVGMLMDIFSAIVVVVPLIIVVAIHFGVNPYHLGVIFLLNLEIGYLMPPAGINLIISSFRFDRPITDLYRSVLPYILILFVALGIVTYIPWLSIALIPGQHEAGPHAAADNHETMAAYLARCQAAEQPHPVEQHPPPGAVRPCGDVPDESVNESFEQYTARCPQGSATPAAAPGAAPTGARPCGDVPDESVNESFEQYTARCPQGSTTPAPR